MSKHHRHKAHANGQPNQSFQQDSGNTQVHDEYSPSFEDIQKRAYLIHEQKGGSELENWLEAEQCLREEYSRHY